MVGPVGGFQSYPLSNPSQAAASEQQTQVRPQAEEQQPKGNVAQSKAAPEPVAVEASKSEDTRQAARSAPSEGTGRSESTARGSVLDITV